jgi:hypothetical protein
MLAACTTRQSPADSRPAEPAPAVSQSEAKEEAVAPADTGRPAPPTAPKPGRELTAAIGTDLTARIDQILAERKRTDKCCIALESVQGDREALYFRELIKNYLRRAGYSIKRTDETRFAEPVHGYRVEYSRSDNEIIVYVYSQP